jgi:AcrR family transcriptional regulator
MPRPPKQARNAAPVVRAGASARNARRGRPPLADREQLLDSAEQAIRRHGPAVSLERIAAAAGVTKPVLFAHVGDRRALVHALAERLLVRIEAAVRDAIAQTPPGRLALERLIAAHLETVSSDRHVYTFVNGAGAGDTELASTLEFAQRSAAPLAAGLASARRRAGLETASADAWAHAIIGMLHMTGLWWLHRSPLDRDAQTLAAQLTELLWNGLAPRAAKEKTG